MPASLSFWFEDSRVMSGDCCPSPIRMRPSKMLVKPKIECRTVERPVPEPAHGGTPDHAGIF
jgi:hypothetical protein